MDKLKQHIQDNLDKLDIDHPQQDLWNSISNNIAPEDTDPLKSHIGQHTAELNIDTPTIEAWTNIENAIVASKETAVIGINKMWWYAAACVAILIGIGFFFYLNRSANSKTGSGIVKTPTKIITPVTGPAVDTSKRNVAVTAPVRNNIKEIKPPAEPEAVDTFNNVVLEPVSKKVAPEAVQQASTKRKKAVGGDVTTQLPPELLQIQTGYDDLIAGQVKYVQSLPVYGESVDYFESFVIDFKRLDGEEKQLRKTIMQKGLQDNNLDELSMIYQQKLMILKKLQSEINKTGRSRNETDTIPGYIKL